MDLHADTPFRETGAVPGVRHTLTLPDGGFAMLHHFAQFSAATRLVATPPPLLVVHSINATASAYEMYPVVMRQSRQRAVVALDLPGFGEAAKPDQAYSPQQMQQAISAAAEWMQDNLGAGSIDVMALSLGSEFATEAVLKDPGMFRTLTLISPTGIEGRRIGERYQDGMTREMSWMRRLLRNTRFGGWMYRMLTKPASINWFLSRSWGTRDVDPRLLEHALRCAAKPGAQHAPLDFIAGALFTKGVIERYRAVPVPMWVAHGTRGSFTDFGACPERSGSVAAGAMHAVERTAFETGAMPHFETPDVFVAAYDKFLLGQRSRSATAGRSAGRAIFNPLKTELRHER